MYSKEHKLEQLRAQLVSQALKVGSFTDERIVRLSQELDKYIVDCQKSMLQPSPGYYYKKTSTG
ncbi:aspartyl-phosphate phosphatase Spo0E family protein [Paenibacillus thalictri]|uniref:Aspartyl-phosphate phosphatase Spo0E family protein n=1 Tax=Paenibacillus thalictri TaxID=2527873 RepID=A0A4Q9DX76_9BACL|nr:aspartyl-phosphate phosphatase Spo0E family protein [Paenibacillus thalictri]TBL81016.1 aspartyl-phosphate phosphatase Spo0E family protein [Paenibacillus thalictri]